MKFFYSHLIEIESVLEELDKLDLHETQKSHLTSLIDSSLHHTILDAILSHLNGQEKRVFVQHLTEGSHDKIWKFLNEKVINVEDKIKKASEDLKIQLHEDISKTRKESKDK